MNELQQVLNEIKTDKIENLKPENLREGVSLLGVDGTAEVPEPIYATGTYDFYNANVDNIVGKYGIKLSMYKDWMVVYRGYNRNSSDSVNNIQFFYKGELIGTKNVTFSSNLFGNFIYVSNNEVIWIYNKQSGFSQIYGGFIINSDTKTITQLDNVDLLDNPSYVSFDGSTIFTDYYTRYDKQTNTVKKYIKMASSFTWSGVPNFIYNNYSQDNVDNTLIKFNYNEYTDSYTQISKKYSDIVGVNYFGNKLFRFGNVYKLNEDLSIGELLKENAYPHQTGSYGRIMTCINDRYYIYAYVTNNNCLYEFDEDTNTFTELSIPNTSNYEFFTGINSLALCGDYNQSTSTISTIIKQFKFSELQKEIGINYKNNTLFYGPQAVFNSNDLLERYIIYNK